MRVIMFSAALLVACETPHYATATLYCPNAPSISVDSVMMWHRDRDELTIWMAHERTRHESPSCTVRWGKP